MPDNIRTGLILTATARGLNGDADQLLARYRSLIRALTGEFDPVLLGE